MFEVLQAFLFNLIPLRVLIGSYVICKLGECVYECIDTNLFKLYFLGNKDKKWEKGYYVDIVIICFNVIKFITYSIVWYIVNNLIDKDISVNLREFTIVRNLDANKYKIHEEDIIDDFYYTINQ